MYISEKSKLSQVEEIFFKNSTHTHMLLNQDDLTASVINILVLRALVEEKIDQGGYFTCLEVRQLEDGKAMTQTRVHRNPTPILSALFRLSNCKNITKVPELPRPLQGQRNGIKLNCLCRGFFQLAIQHPFPFSSFLKKIPILFNYPSTSRVTQATQKSLPFSNSGHRF